MYGPLVNVCSPRDYRWELCKLIDTHLSCLFECCVPYRDFEERRFRYVLGLPRKECHSQEKGIWYLGKARIEKKLLQFRTPSDTDVLGERGYYSTGVRKMIADEHAFPFLLLHGGVKPFQESLLFRWYLVSSSNSLTLYTTVRYAHSFVMCMHLSYRQLASDFDVPERIQQNT